MTNIDGNQITREMVRQHAKMHDEDFMGEIILSAIGIRGYCEGFCINRNFPGHYNLYWGRDGEVYGETFSEDDIMNALGKAKITVERK